MNIYKALVKHLHGTENSFLKFSSLFDLRLWQHLINESTDLISTLDKYSPLLSAIFGKKKKERKISKNGASVKIEVGGDLFFLLWPTQYIYVYSNAFRIQGIN
jgi:hypothetical protein